MEDEKFPETTIQWIPKGRRKRRPARVWSENIQEAMMERNLTEYLYSDRAQWRKSLEIGPRRYKPINENAVLIRDNL